jgi:tripartite-type tricarboxylate transporter receptor subunit TctC
MIHRRKFVFAFGAGALMAPAVLIARAAAALLTVACACAAHAQSYPNRSIHVIVPFPPGGGIDLFARVLGKKLSDQLGQQVVIDNRPGA